MYKFIKIVLIINICYFSFAIDFNIQTLSPSTKFTQKKYYKNILLLTKFGYAYQDSSSVKQKNKNFISKLSKLFAKIRSQYLGKIPHVGAGIIANELIKSGCKVSIKDLYDDKILKNTDSFDLILISFMDISFERVIEILRNLDKDKIILGGIGATTLKDKIRKIYPDITIVSGESEGLIPQILEDHSNNMLKTDYKRSYPVDLFHENDLNQYHDLKMFKESAMQVIEVGRGCPYKCEFCITSKYNPKISYKPLNILQNELDQIKQGLKPKILVIIDQNLFSYPRDYVLKVLQMINKKKILWVGEGTIQDVINDKEILKEMSKYCLQFLVGVEDLTSNKVEGASTKNTLKKNFEETLSIIRKFQIPVIFSMIFGTDNQNIDVFEKTKLEILKYKITTLPHIATPRAGTLWDKTLDLEGRIIDNEYAHREQKMHLVFEPKNMRSDEFLIHYTKFYKDVFSLKNVAKKIIFSLKTMKTRHIFTTILFEMDGVLTRMYLTKRNKHFFTSAV